MIVNNINFLHLVILSMAEEQYKNEVIETQMESILIGSGLEWSSKEEWMSDYIVQHFNEAKQSLIKKYGYQAGQDSLEYENTITMRLYSLDIGEAFDFDNFNRITRFPGGWVFKNHSTDMLTFIPYNDEFNNKAGILKKEIEAMGQTQEFIDVQGI